MATTLYRQQPSLIDVLTQGGEGPPPMAQPDDFRAVPRGVDPSLVDQAYAPDDIGTRPEVNELGGGRRLALSLSDALNSAASVLGRTDVRTNNLASYLDYIEGQKQAGASYDRLKASQESEAKKGKARYLLGRHGEREALAQAAADKKAEAAEKAALKKIETEQATNAAILKRQQELDDQERADRIKREDAETKFGYDKILAGIRAADSNGDPDSKHDKKALLGPKGLLFEIGEMVDDNTAGLVDGTVTPERMEKLIENRIEIEGLSEKGAEAARLLFRKRVTPIIRGKEVKDMNADLATGSPQQANPFWDPLRALGRARSGQ